MKTTEPGRVEIDPNISKTIRQHLEKKLDEPSRREELTILDVLKQVAELAKTDSREGEQLREWRAAWRSSRKVNPEFRETPLIIDNEEVGDGDVAGRAGEVQGGREGDTETKPQVVHFHKIKLKSGNVITGVMKKTGRDKITVVLIGTQIVVEIDLDDVVNIQADPVDYTRGLLEALKDAFDSWLAALVYEWGWALEFLEWIRKWTGWTPHLPKKYFGDPHRHHDFPHDPDDD
jgi:hypothetical protein